MKYFNIFSVPIQATILELNIDSLIEFCYEMKRKNEKGVEVSNIGGWQSNNVVDETHTEFVKLKNKIEETANIYHREIQLKKIYDQKIVNIWVNINQKGHLNDYHIHTKTILSGTFYLTQSQASIVFRHPFCGINNYYWEDFSIEEWNEINSELWALNPRPNELIIFPPWLWHKVSMNKEDTDRISISFNTHLQEKDTNI